MRRIAHYASITVENRIEWQRRMIRTRLVDEELKDLFTNGLPTPMEVVLVERVSDQPGRKEWWLVQQL